MALLIVGVSDCSICGSLLTQSDVDAGRIVSTTHFIPFEDHPLWRFSDSSMHKSCFQTWPHREEFAALCMLAVQHDHLLKLLGLTGPPEKLLEWDQRKHSFLGVLDWDGTSEAWTCHLAHERLSFKVYLQADGRSRMFPFETAGRQIEALLAELESLRQRVEVKANENVVVDHAAFESNEPIKLDGAHWSKAHLAELWVSCWGEIEAYFSTDALPDGTYLVAVIDRQGRVEGVARRVRHPDLGDAG